MRVASWLASVLLLSTHQCTWTKPNANHSVDLLRAGSLTHDNNTMVFELKNLSGSVDRIPMLPVCVLRVEPPITSCARRAPNAFDEILAHFSFQITSASICDHPRFRGSFNVGLVYSSYTFHRMSVDVEENFVFLHLYRPNFSIEPLAFRRRLAVLACLHTSPQNTLSDLWRHLRADVRELSEVTLHPTLDILGRGSNW